MCEYNAGLHPYSCIFQALDWGGGCIAVFRDASADYLAKCVVEDNRRHHPQQSPTSKNILKMSESFGYVGSTVLLKILPDSLLAKVRREE